MRSAAVGLLDTCPTSFRRSVLCRARSFSKDARSVSSSRMRLSDWTRVWRIASATTAESLPMPRIWSITNRSISAAGMDLDGQLCHPRFWAFRQT